MTRWCRNVHKSYNKIQERQDLRKIDETIVHMYIECQWKNKNKTYLVGVFYQPRP